MWSSIECHRLNLMQALRFYGSFNVLVAGITIVNSSQCHLKFDNCQGVMVHDVTISSPENSLNTDGIHLGLTESLHLSSIPPVQSACQKTGFRVKGTLKNCCKGYLKHPATFHSKSKVV